LRGAQLKRDNFAYTFFSILLYNSECIGLCDVTMESKEQNTKPIATTHVNTSDLHKR